MHAPRDRAVRLKPDTTYEHRRSAFQPGPQRVHQEFQHVVFGQGLWAGVRLDWPLLVDRARAPRVADAADHLRPVTAGVQRELDEIIPPAIRRQAESIAGSEDRERIAFGF